MNNTTKFLLSLVIAGILSLGAWHMFAERNSSNPHPASPVQVKASPGSGRATEPHPVAVESENRRIESPSQIASAVFPPIETKETPGGQVKILRTFGPDGKLRQEEVRLNGQLKAVRHSNSEGFLALEVREDPKGQIRIQRTFNLLNGQLVKEEAFQNGVPVPVPQRAEWD